MMDLQIPVEKEKFWGFFVVVQMHEPFFFCTVNLLFFFKQ